MKENRFCDDLPKPVQKPFEDLSSCFSIFKSPKGWLVNELAFMKVHVKKPRETTPPLESLSGCKLFVRSYAKRAATPATVPVPAPATTASALELTLVLAEDIQDDESICEVPVLPRPIADPGTPRIGTGSWTDDSVQGLSESASMFKEPKGWSSKVMNVNVKKEKEVIAPLEGLRGCSLFTIPTTCSKCCLQGHNIRSCQRTGLVRQFAVSA